MQINRSWPTKFSFTISEVNTDIPFTLSACPQEVSQIEAVNCILTQASSTTVHFFTYRHNNLRKIHEPNLPGEPRKSTMRLVAVARCTIYMTSNLHPGTWLFSHIQSTKTKCQALLQCSKKISWKNRPVRVYDFGCGNSRCEIGREMLIPTCTTMTTTTYSKQARQRKYDLNTWRTTYHSLGKGKAAI